MITSTRITPNEVERGSEVTAPAHPSFRFRLRRRPESGRTGTFGTIIAIPIVLSLRHFGWIALFVFACTAIACGIHLCGESARRMDVHDHPGIVWDEIAGYTVTMLAAPPEWYWLVAGFVLFRFFDIVKPWPIREADHSLSGGLGIMLDDVIAGVFSAAILFGLKSFV